MIIRIQEGTQGIVNYLIDGRKQGREYTRDNLDSRLTLSGNINMLETVIDAMHVRDGSAKYKHVTLGLAETQISEEKLQEICSRFKELLLNAYDENEVCFYAEAHIPKVTHDVDYTNGTMRERLPHIHIVIPITNMVTHKYLNPFGYKDTKFIDAIQETINKEFNLKSPKSVVALSNLSLEKHKGDRQKVVEIKREIDRLVSTGEIKSFDKLHNYLNTVGQVRIRNEGKDSAYCNVKLSDEHKGINIKDFPLEFFNKINENADAIRETRNGQTKEDLDTWLKSKSYEVKLITSYQRNAYAELKPEEREVFLNTLIVRDQERVANLLEQFTLNPNEINTKQIYEPREHRQPTERSNIIAASVLQSYLTKMSKVGGSTSIGERLRDMPDLGLAQDGGSKMLLPFDAQNSLGKTNADNLNVRWTRKGADSDGRGNGKTIVKETQAAINGKPKIDYNAVSFEPILAYAQRQGILPENLEYQLSLGADAKPRIIIDSKTYNVTDLFTKYLKLDFELTKAILYQVEKQIAQSNLPASDEKFSFKFIEKYAADKKYVLDSNKEKNKLTRSEWLSKRVEVQKTVRLRRAANNQLPRLERKTANDELEKFRLDSLKNLRDIYAPKILKYNDNMPSYKASYKSFLTALAEQGGIDAVTELRRLAALDTPIGRLRASGNFLTGKQKQNVFIAPHYKVDDAGNVSYFRKKINEAFVIDSATSIKVESRSIEESIFALRLAVAKYGANITVSGNKKFVEEMLRAAKLSGLTLNLTIIEEGKKRDEVQKIIPNYDKNNLKPFAR